MSLSNKQRINLQLDAHHLALEVDRDKEEYYRQAAIMLNKRHKYYVEHFSSASAELLWVYVALEVATNLCSDAQKHSIEPVLKELSDMNREIESLLNIKEDN